MIIKSFDQLSSDELYDILQARSEVFVVEQACVYQDIDGKDKDAYHVLLKDCSGNYSGNNNKLLAYLRILKKGQSYREVSIGRVLTTKAGRSKGLGRDLIKAAIDFITQEMKEDAIRISAQAYLESFYESFGFQRVSENYLEDDIEHLEMLYKRS